MIVCTANVCRSPAAEGLVRKHLNQSAQGRFVRVWSAGTAVGAPGRRPDPRVVEIGEGMGAKLRQIRAKAITPHDLMCADHVWVMEEANLHCLEEAFPGDTDRVSLFDPQGGEIPDPYYGSRAEVRKTMKAIDLIARARVMQVFDDWA